jgi:hypothetical protein
MQATIIHRSWPAEEEAESVAAQLQLEADVNRMVAARDLQRSLHDLEFTAELGALTDRAHQQVAVAIAALRKAVDDQWQNTLRL